jgi:uncharacterized surface protein with fasciclin (FAS1) repeats
MKAISLLILLPVLFIRCNENAENTNAQVVVADVTKGQSGVKDETSMPDIVKTAIASPDHTTLVKAVQAADYVDVLSNAGPFTVFAPTDKAFEALPTGTLHDLLKPENKAALQNILEYHVFVGVIETEKFIEGKQLNQVNLQNVVLHVNEGEYFVNDARVVGSVKSSNGIIHVIDKVLLPK